MFGITIEVEHQFGRESFAAVSASKSKVLAWLDARQEMIVDRGDTVLAWRMRDRTGWCDGSQDAWKFINSFGASGGNGVKVLW
jgi:hypothetical protein